MELPGVYCGQLPPFSEDHGSVPSYNGKRGLEPPMVDVFDHTNIPKQIRAEDVIPRKLPYYGWNPLRWLAFLQPPRSGLAYHSHPRRHKPGDV